MEDRLRHVLRNGPRRCVTRTISSMRERMWQGQKGVGRKKVGERCKKGKKRGKEESRRRAARKRTRSLRVETSTQRRGNKRRTTLSRGRVWGCNREGEGVSVSERVWKQEKEWTDGSVQGDFSGVDRQSSWLPTSNEPKKAEREERQAPVQATGKAKPRHEPARISEFLDNTIRTVPAFRPSFLPTTD